MKTSIIDNRGSNDWFLSAAFKPSVTSGSSSTTLTYTYDENGKRVMLVDPNSTTTRYYSGLYQDTLGGYKKTKNIFVNGALLATFEKTGSASATPYYVLTDPLNSASILMNSSGVATQTLDYLPYGDVRVNAKQTSYDSERKFLGKINDTATNLDYLEARYYQSPLGRFISQDPMQWGVPDIKSLLKPQSLNFYGYSENNPINRSDPSGLRSTTDAENIYIQETRNQINYLNSIGNGTAAVQMSNNLNALIQEIGRMQQSSGGNYLAPPPVENKVLGVGAIMGDALRQSPWVAASYTAFAAIPIPQVKAVAGGVVVVLAAGTLVYEGYEWLLSNSGKGKGTPRPNDAPTGTKPIDEVGLPRGTADKIKKEIDAKPNDWVGRAPNGDIITATPDGKAINHGPIETF